MKPKTNESQAIRHAKFRRLAVARVKKITKYFRLLGNLTGRNYFHTPAEAQKVIEFLEKELNNLKIKFEPTEIEFQI